MNIVQVKILKNLPLALCSTREIVVKYNTSRMFKVFETFAYLKAITTSGKIFNGECSKDAHVKYLAKCCNLTRNTMYNRLVWLEKEKLIEIDKRGNILLESWETIALRYGIQNKEFYEININEQSPNLEYILKTLVISEIKSRLSYRFAQIISNNQLRVRLENILGKWSSLQELAEKIIRLQQDTFKNWSDSYDLWHSLRADFNCNMETLKKYFCFNDSRTVAYLKKVLVKRKLITVVTRKTESKKCTRLPRDIFRERKVIPLNFIWDNKTKTRIWQQPDAITVTL